MNQAGALQLDFVLERDPDKSLKNWISPAVPAPEFIILKNARGGAADDHVGILAGKPIGGGTFGKIYNCTVSSARDGRVLNGVVKIPTNASPRPPRDFKNELLTHWALSTLPHCSDRVVCLLAAFKTTLRIPDPENEDQQLAFYPTNYYHCLILEKMDGDLWALTQKMASLDDDDVKKRYIIFFAREMAEAVGLMHANGFFHNDIKPANFLYKWDGNKYVVKVGDLGIACRRENSKKTVEKIIERLSGSFGKSTVLHRQIMDLVSEQGVLSCILAGTPGYMSQEKKAEQIFAKGGAQSSVSEGSGYDQMFMENDICGVRMSVFYMARNMGLNLGKHPEIKKLALSVGKEHLTMALLNADIPDAMIGDIYSREFVPPAPAAVTESERSTTVAD